jgi:hypothetical protein
MTKWLKDDRGNKCSVEYFGSEEAAKTALDGLENCDNCTNCSDCSRCSDCSGCSDCSRCSDCSNIAWLDYEENLQANPEVKAVGEAGPPPIPVIANIHQAVFNAASQPNSLDMSTWHTCDNTHCWAGWVVTLAGKEGKKLERFFDTPLAAMKILDASSPITVSPVRFFETTADALREMKKLADQEAGR